MMARNALLLLAAAALVAIPLTLSFDAPEPFAGADGKALETARQLNPDYEPWAEALWTPSGSVETLLFSLQAALGAGVLGYYLGLRRGRSQGRRAEEEKRDASA